MLLRKLAPLPPTVGARRCVWMGAARCPVKSMDGSAVEDTPGKQCCVVMVKFDVVPRE